MRGTWALAAIVVGLTASGCSSLNGASAQLQAAKTVGIVSAIGDDFTLTRAGLTGLDDTERHASIEAWGLDDLIVARVGARLGQRFQITPVSYARASFAARQQPSAFTPLNLKNRHDAGIGDLIRTEVSPQGLDVYVVITKAESAYGSRGRKVAGIGTIQHLAVFGSSTMLHALYTVTLVDGHSMKVIGKRSASPPDNAELFRLSGPSREIDAGLISAAANPGGSEALKAAVIDLIDHSLAGALSDLVDRSAS
jgi:hypothetical protein